MSSAETHTHQGQVQSAVEGLTRFTDPVRAEQIVTILGETMYGSSENPYGDFLLFTQPTDRIGQLMMQEANKKVATVLGEDRFKAHDAVETYAVSFVRARKAIVLEERPNAPFVSAVAYIEKNASHGLTPVDFDHAQVTWSRWETNPLKTSRVILYAVLVETQGPMIAHAVEDRWMEVHAAVGHLKQFNNFDLDRFLVEKVGRVMAGVPRDLHDHEDIALKPFVRNTVALRQLAMGNRKFLSTWVEYNLVRAKQMDDTDLDIERIEGEIEHVLEESNH